MKELQDRFPDADGQQKLCLAYGLAHLDQVDVSSIIDGLVDEQTHGEEITNIIKALTDAKAQAIENLRSSASAATENQEWQIKTRLAVVAMYLDELSIAVEMLAATNPNPVQRTALVSTFPELAFGIESMPENLGGVDNPHFRSGICLSVGGIEQPVQVAVVMPGKARWKTGTCKHPIVGLTAPCSMGFGPMETCSS